MRCLLVDDEPGIREGLAMLLRRRGFEVRTAPDCAAARRLLADEGFDAVVTDWRLPDGLASSFAADASCPVIAMSGHPEEVERAANTRAVLAKPVRPADLLSLLERLGAERDGEALAGGDRGDGDAMAPDVRKVVEDVVAQLPPGAVVRCEDDGTFVVLRAALPAGSVPMVRPLGGDLRLIEDAGARELELRVCRDGQPELTSTVVPFEAEWPAACGRLALDCRDLQLGADEFARRLDRVAERDSAAGRICLLNVPEHLESATAVWETTHDMPMREPVGPRLSAELAELWS